MRKYGDYSELTESNANEIATIVQKIEEKDISCTLFYGFPLIELDNTSTIMKGCIISSKGIIILHDSDDERKVYWRHINKTIMECPSVSDLAMDPSSGLISFKKCNDIDGIVNQLLNNDDIMSIDDVDLLVAVIQKAYNLSKFDDRAIQNKDSIGSIIKKRNNKVSILDEEQFEEMMSFAQNEEN